MRTRFAATCVLALAATTALAACGSDDDGGNTGGDENVTLTVWDRSILRPEFGQDILAPAFEEAHPGVTVEYIEQPSDIAQADQAFRSASLAEEGPDVVSLYAGGMVSSFADFLEPLDDQLTDDDIDALDGWDTVRQDFDADGALLGVPFGAGTYFEVFCNTDVLTAAGVDASTPPATWPDFLDFLGSIRDGGQVPVMMGNQEGYTGAWVMAALVGGQIGTDGFFEMYAGDRPIDSDEFVDAYTAYQELFTTDGLTNPDAGSLTNGDGETKFFNGEGACFISGDWQDGPLDENIGADKIVTFPIPVLDSSSNVGAKAGGTAAALAVTNYSDNKDLAIEFVKFATSQEMLDAYVEALQIEPSNHRDANVDLIQNPLLRTQTEATVAASEQGPEFLIFPFDSIMPQQVNDLFYRMNAAVAGGQTSPEDAAAQLQAEYENWQLSQ